MIEKLPAYISNVFLFTTVLTVILFYWVIKSSEEKSHKKYSFKILLGLTAWLILQSLLSLNGTYSDNIDSLPPLIFLYGIFPTVTAIICLFVFTSGRKFIDQLPLKKLTYLNIVRIPVEFVLLWLYLNKTIPVILTFEGWNFDIVMGLTAPFIIYYGFVKNKLNKNVILFWNVIGIFFLTLVFSLAVLSSPFPLQQLAFEQPNIALLHFPYSLLPTFIVPLVILGHLISIRQLLKKESSN